MPAVKMFSSGLLEKRYITCYGDGCYNTWNWGRWLMLGLIIAGVAVLMFLICCNNNRRRNKGMKPMRGTAWLTPPSYGQATANQPAYDPNAVPQYTPNANPQDAGYYDANGNFVPVQHTGANFASQQPGSYPGNNYGYYQGYNAPSASGTSQTQQQETGYYSGSSVPQVPPNVYNGKS